MYVMLTLPDGYEIPLRLWGLPRDWPSKPVTSTAHVWKHEVYFKAFLRKPPAGEKTSRLRKGDVAYWFPGKALCIFYGFSHSYTPVVLVGEALGPLAPLQEIREGDKVTVKRYEDPELLKKHLDALRKAGFAVAARMDDEGTITIVGNLEISGLRIGIETFVEDYGVYTETEGLFRFTRTPACLRMLSRLEKAVVRETGMARVDLNEQGEVCLSICSEEPEKLPELYGELKKAVKAIKDILWP